MKKHILPIILLVTLSVFIGWANFVPGTWLSGWDTIHAEFNLGLNIKRSIFAVWQEYQGLGLLGGMGHAADLPRQLLFGMSSVIMPAQLMRYLWTVLMLILGPIGAYNLAYSITKQRISALGGAIFYLCNLVTVQTFFAPYEAFVAHYGAFPWLIWSTTRMLSKHTKLNVILFIFIHLFFMTASYVPTLFLVYLIIFFALAVHELLHRSKSIKRILMTGLIIFCLHAFWLLPFVYNTFTNSSTIVNAKINQMATEENFLKNQKYGTVEGTLTLKNFWFETTEYYPKLGISKLMLAEWRAHTESTAGKAALTVLALTIISGCLYAFWKAETRIWGVLGLLGFTMLASDTMPFSFIASSLRSSIPLLAQFFRFPFTKWGVELATSYSIFVALALYAMSIFLKKYKAISYVFFTLLLGTSLFLFIPAFTGKLIDQQMLVSMPEEYNQLFAFMEHKPMGRITNLPQPAFWDWKYYNWGQLGSGFLWYGVEQPIADRAFDIWGKTNENYYWELSRAMYAKDASAVESVLAKYDIRYIILDENIRSTTNDRTLFVPETKTLLMSLPTVKEAAKFGKLTVYERTNESDASFVSVKTNLPAVSPTYNWSDNDVAYKQLGTYQSSSTLNPLPSAIYPYRSLFTKRSVNEREFTIKETSTTIVIGSTTEATSASILKEPSLAYDSAKTQDLSATSVVPCGPLEGKIATQFADNALQFSTTNTRSCLSFGIPKLSHKYGYIVTVESKHESGRPLTFALINQTAKHTELETYLPVRTDWNTSYFILPPLASDGLGYNVYVSNDSIGRQTTTNDLRDIRIYQIPYNEMVNMRSPTSSVYDLPSTINDLKVEHPNPSYYKFTASTLNLQHSTLLLSQSFNDGWKAYDVSTCSSGNTVIQSACESLPFLFGKEIKNHVLVNNWKNGWTLNNEVTVVIFFLPQLLEYMGFLLLSIPFLAVLLTRTSRHPTLNS